MRDPSALLIHSLTTFISTSIYQTTRSIRFISIQSIDSIIIITMAKKRKQPTETTETTNQPPSNSISTNESTITSTNNNNHNISDGRYRNKSRLLLLSSRSTTARYRHLLEDLHTLLPHAKKESKLDVTKNDKGGFGAAINEIAEMNRCSSVAFLEVRKRGMDGYLWLGHTGHVEGTGSAGAVNTDTLTAPTFTPGPSAKFHITNIHTMDELKLTGNCMKGSRPILSFDQAFDSQEPELAHLKLVRHLMMQVFGTPRGHPRSKPFVDRVMAFYYGDGKVSWLVCLLCFVVICLFV